MKTLIHYLRVYFCIVRNSLMIILNDRFDFLLWTFVHLFELYINILFFQIIFLRTGSIGGWNIYQVLVLLGFMEMTLALGGLTFYPMMYRFSKMIRQGELDWKLVKPMDTQFLVTFPWTDISDSMSLVTGGLLIGYAITHLIGFSIINILLFGLSVFLAMIIIYSSIVLMLCLAFKTTNINYIEWFFWNIQWLGRYPATVFKGTFHFIFMFVVPVGLISTVPAQTLFGQFNLTYFLVATVYATVLFILSRKLFTKSLKSYSSASS